MRFGRNCTDIRLLRQSGSQTLRALHMTPTATYTSPAADKQGTRQCVEGGARDVLDCLPDAALQLHQGMNRVLLDLVLHWPQRKKSA